MPFHQLGAHLIGQEGMFVIGRVVDAGRQHRHHRAPRTCGRRAGCQRAAQGFGIVADRTHTDFREQLRKHVQHRLPVLQHVGDAGGRARIVLQNEEFVLAGAHQINADNMSVHLRRGHHADHLRQECVIVLDELHRNTPGTKDFLAVIDIMQERVDRPHALLDALDEPCPFLPGNDPGHNIERDQPLVRVCGAIDVEGNACAAEERFRLARLLAEPLGRLLGKPITITGIGSAGFFTAAVHLVEKPWSFSHRRILTPYFAALNALLLGACLAPNPPTNRAKRFRCCTIHQQSLMA